MGAFRVPESARRRRTQHNRQIIKNSVIPDPRVRYGAIARLASGEEDRR